MSTKLLQTVIREQYVVSTVKLNFGRIGMADEYETMVFNYDAEARKVTDWLELDSSRCDTEAGATLDHFEYVMKWSTPE